MKLQKLCSPLGISNDHNVTRAILNDTISGNKERGSSRNLRLSLKGADSMVLELVSSVTINITLDFTTCCKSSLQDHLGSLKARVESRHVRRA
ncbi:hypothetical protein NC651_013553 [Populus alba x Populus x berolinensis]|nr:hypothetical protein NC651_013553 [Populus alba x Populus x berolinensis]